MNIAKNMEVIFISAVALIGSASLATAAGQARHQARPVVTSQVQTQSGATMQVITVSAKRLSAAEKAQLAQ